MRLSMVAVFASDCICEMNVFDTLAGNEILPERMSEARRSFAFWDE